MHRLALAALGDRAVAGRGAKTHLGHVADAERRCRRALAARWAHVVEGCGCAFGTDQQGFLAIGQAAGAVVAVVGFEYRLQIL